MTARATDAVAAAGGARFPDELAAVSKGREGAASALADALRCRLGGADVPTPDGLEGGARVGPGPEPLPFNTRVHCAVCGVPAHTASGGQTHACAACRNVTYCSPEHRDADAKRHGYWCRG